MHRKIQVIGFITIIFAALAVWQLYPPFDVRDAEGNIIEEGSINLGLDLQGGMYLKLAIDDEELPENMVLEEAVNRALEILRNRIDSLGVAEPIIQREGEKFIVIQLPGVNDPERALDIIGKTALLEFKLVSERHNITDMTDEDGEIDPELVPEGIKVLKDRNDERYPIEDKELLTGADLEDARVQMGEYGAPIVGFKLSPEGGKAFSEITMNNVDRRLAIILDDIVVSAPVIRSRISGGEGIIEGSFDLDSAKDLALILRAGALPAPVKIENKIVVGPSLGEDSINAGKKSIFIGALLVLIFMFIYYRMSGLVANLGLALTFLFVMGVLAALNATLTLPGIAGLTLTLGMAIDSNVLIFERIREELKTGKTVRAAIDAGYNRALWTIIDSHVTSLITAIILFQFGTGPIRGFAVTLFWGVAISLFTAFFVTKSIFDLRKQYKKLSI
ncbi:MAG: protein translocase subunit SecD [Candidatus Goldiibacteriota bacterium]